MPRKLLSNKKTEGQSTECQWCSIKGPWVRSNAHCVTQTPAHTRIPCERLAKLLVTLDEPVGIGDGENFP